MRNYHSPLGDSNRDLRYMSEAVGDMEYTAPYIGKLMNDPVARLGWDPSKMHTAVWPESRQHGAYVPSVNSPYAMNNKSLDRFRAPNFLDPLTKLEPDNMYYYPGDISQTWPYNETVLHESRHRGYDLLGLDEPNEELINRFADTLKGDKPIRDRASYYLTERMPNNMKKEDLAGRFAEIEAMAIERLLAPLGKPSDQAMSTNLGKKTTPEPRTQRGATQQPSASPVERRSIEPPPQRMPKLPSPNTRQSLPPRPQLAPDTSYSIPEPVAQPSQAIVPRQIEQPLGQTGVVKVQPHRLRPMSLEELGGKEADEARAQFLNPAAARDKMVQEGTLGTSQRPDGQGGMATWYSVKYK